MENRPLHFTSSSIHHVSLYHEQIVIDSELPGGYIISGGKGVASLHILVGQVKKDH